MKPTIKSILAGLSASLLLLMIEMARLYAAPAHSGAHGASYFLDLLAALAPDHLALGLLAAALVLAISSARALVKKPIWRTLLPTLAPVPVFFWVAVELSLGSGVVRSGLQVPVIMGLPFAATLSLWFLVLGLERLERFGPWPAALVLAGLGIALGSANRELYVGLYAPIHEALQLFELFAATVVFHMFWFRRSESPAPIKALAGLLIGLGLAFQGLSLWPIGAAPNELLRSLYTRHGFYSATLLNWRARIDPLEIDDGSIDETLKQSIEDWNLLALSLEEELDRRLPDRRIANLLFISIDTLRPDRLGCYGNKAGLTPNIDALAAEATVFETAYSQYPSTALSTESFFHGRYPRATGIYRKNKGELSKEDARVLRISELARLNRMRTAAAIAFTEEWMTSPLFAKSLESFELVNPERAGAPKLDGEYFADSAMAAMRQLQAERFFLWFHLFDPHHPYELRPDYAKSDDASGRYDGEVKYADEQLGRLLHFMKEAGLWDNTVIVLTSDHGEAFGEKGGIRYHGSSLQEAQIRIPLIIRVPGLPPQRVPEIAENVDLYQTLSSLLALEGNSPNQGSDLTPLLVDHARFAANFPSFAYSELPDDVAELSSASTKLASLREGKWKLIRHLTTQFSELYNVVDDPKETRDLSTQETVVKLRMEKKLRTLAQWTENFGRKVSSAEIRRRKLEEAKTSLRNENPYVVFEGLSFVQENDLDELIAIVRNLALDPDEYPELRTRALRMLPRWEHEAWPQQALAWLEDPNPVFRWVGGWLILDELNRIMVGTSKAPVNLPMDVLKVTKDWDLPSPLPLMAAALRVSAARAAGQQRPEADEAADLRLIGDAIDDRLIEKNLRTSLILAVADRLPKPLKYSAHFDDTALRQEFLSVLWATGCAGAWLDYARQLLPDRYLPEVIKSRILTVVLDHFSDEVAKEVGVSLLARWDPSFHDEVTKRLSSRFDDAIVRDLQRCHGRIADGRDLLATGNHKAAVEAFSAASLMVPSSQATLAVDLDRLRSLIALDRWDEARSFREGLVERAKASESAAMIHRAQALVDYSAIASGLSAESKVRIREVSINRGNAEWTEADGDFEIDVLIENNDTRPLLSGPFKHGGRLRVLWDDPTGGEAIYGSECELSSDLLPTESIRQTFRVKAPAEPGRWQARVIVNEHQGARFHVVEDAAARFEIFVGRPHLGPPNGEWGPLKIANSFEFDPSLEGILPAADDESLFLVAESYEGAFRSPVLGFDGQERKLTIRGRWWSGIPGANLVRVELKPAPGFKALPATFADISWGGEEFKIEMDLPRAAGYYQIELRIGYRQGLLELQSISLR